MNYYLLFASVVFSVFTASAHCTSTEGLPPPPAVPKLIIFDTDIGYDIDDTMALDSLVCLQQLGYVQLLAVTTVTGSAQDLAPAYVSLVLAYANLRGVLVGAYQGLVSTNCQSSPTRNSLLWAFQHAPNLGVLPLGRSTFPSALTTLKAALQSAPNGSVTLIAVGPLMNIHALLQDTEGAALFESKVSAVYTMGGDYPESVPGSEFNYTCDRDRGPIAAQALFSRNGSVPVYGVANQLGGSTRVGANTLNVLPTDSPVYASVYFSCGGESCNPATFPGRYMWDPSTVLFAAMGPGSIPGVGLGSGGGVSTNGTNTVQSSPYSNSWSSSTASNHFYVTASAAGRLNAKAMIDHLLGQDIGNRGRFPRVPTQKKGTEPGRR